jgi:hypothetical protein
MRMSQTDSPRGSPDSVRSCIPVIPSVDLEKSLRFWVEGLGLAVERPMHRDGRLVGCMVGNVHLSFWLNERAGTPHKPANYEGIRLYWAPGDLYAVRDRLGRLGYRVSELAEREYGQTEFQVTDDDGYSHCFGVPRESNFNSHLEEPPCSP